ncbi:MAG: hypothetical protein BIP78_1379 [Candidatus Bipolaricaulis sibiricus]|uniref:Uncharacterized protein n=1 Tax=Bipolaricaulis sibiricus TaxID=2501609 RepID=A0A410FVK9_BIPS1|nr:MAG: hypothetical protein BIP78_1379 [Candidatus Bipolaricaulis sibiricus]
MSLGPLAQILVAVLMMVGSVVLAFLMVMRILQPTLGLCFATFFLTLAGFIIGIIGMVQYIRPRSGDRG